MIQYTTDTAQCTSFLVKMMCVDLSELKVTNGHRWQGALLRPCVHSRNSSLTRIIDKWTRFTTTHHTRSHIGTGGVVHHHVHSTSTRAPWSICIAFACFVNWLQPQSHQLPGGDVVCARALHCTLQRQPSMIQALHQCRQFG